MIVRDELEHLPACLQSLDPIAPEICIIDTGSVDGTAELAEAQATRFGVQPWRGDFSVARNASLALCTRPWILVLDADERLSPETAQFLQNVTAAKPDCAWRFVTRTYTNERTRSGFVPSDAAEARGYAGWFPSKKVRLFPNAPGIQFRGLVHELLEPSLVERGVPICEAPVSIAHYPYERDAEALRRKQERYIELGLRKLEHAPDDVQAHFELANQLAEAGLLSQALRVFRQGLGIDSSRPDMWKDFGAVLHLAGHDAEAERALRIAIEIDPDVAEAWRNLGVVLVACGRGKEAADAFRRVLALDPAWADGPVYLAEALKSVSE